MRSIIGNFISFWHERGEGLIAGLGFTDFEMKYLILLILLW